MPPTFCLCSKDTEGERVERGHEEAVRDYLDAWENGDLDRLDEIFGERVTVHGPRQPPIERSVDDMKAVVGDPDMADTTFTTKDLLSCDDRVVLRFEMQCTHRPSGRHLTQSGIKIYRFERGRIVEFWGEDDTLGVCLQLGLIDPASLPADFVGDLPDNRR